MQGQIRADFLAAKLLYEMISYLFFLDSLFVRVATFVPVHTFLSQVQCIKAQGRHYVGTYDAVKNCF